MAERDQIKETRTVRDTIGEMEIAVDAPWGAQTQRSLRNFPIGRETMPWAQIRAMLEIKLAAAKVNADAERLDPDIGARIQAVCENLIEEEDLSKFPLTVWQTGSGTQTNMNVNEVVAELCNRNDSGPRVHPNDHVNRGQSSNDVFPAGMHIAGKRLLEQSLIPALDMLIGEFHSLEDRAVGAVKIGRTHLQDAVPIGFAQEVSGWRAALEQDRELIVEAAAHLEILPLGGTAVGTGLNSYEGYPEAASNELSYLTGLRFRPAANFFSQLGGKNFIVNAHGALRVLATDLHKIANDIRLLASGPRSGLSEIELPANEPGSSIMPGKVNPTQCEALCMLCAQVMGNDVALGFAGASGHLQLNTYMPLMIYNLEQSALLLSDGCRSFAERCVSGIVVNQERMRHNVERSLMLVTRLAPEIGYETCAAIVKKAFAEDLDLKEVAVEGNYVTAKKFEELMRIEDMLRPDPKG